ncbi:MAG: hypothetical protein Hens2KO_27800 [Henriciella sp.]
MKQLEGAEMKSRQTLLFFIAFVIGTIGWWKQLGYAGFTWPQLFDVSYRSIQLFLGNFDLPSNITEPVPNALQIARFLAPLVTIWAIFELVGGQVAGLPGAAWAALTGRPEIVVVGFGDVGKAVAYSLSESKVKGRKPRIFVLDRSLDNAELGYAREINVEARLVDAKAIGAWMSWVSGLSRAQRVFVAVGDDDKTLQIVDVLISENCVSANKIWAHIGGYPLLERLRDIEPNANDKIKVLPRYFSLYEAAVEKFLISDAPFTESQSNGCDRMRFALVGIDKYSLPLVENLAIYGIYGPPDFSIPIVTIIDEEADKFKTVFEARHPELKNWVQVNAISMCGDELSWMKKNGVLHVSLDESLINHWVFANRFRAQGLALYRGMTMEARSPAKIFIGNEATESRARVAGASGDDDEIQLTYFGNLREASLYSVALNETLQNIARRFHEKWAMEDGPKFEDLSESMRMSNWRAAMHAVLKLKLLGYENADPTKSALGMSEGQIKRLEKQLENAKTSLGVAELEHLRWCADRLLDGWTPGSERNDKKRTRPQLHFGKGQYDELDQSEIDKDRQQLTSLIETLRKVIAQ